VEGILFRLVSAPAVGPIVGILSKTLKSIENATKSGGDKNKR
jgi:hypothetical protein